MYMTPKLKTIIANIFSELCFIIDPPDSCRENPAGLNYSLYKPISLSISS
jgi:hypothetical protein